MAKRRMSDWNSFVSARMRALSPADRAEAQMAMRQIASEWRELNHAANSDELDNPMPRRRRYSRRRRNPSSNSMLKYLLIGGALYFFLLRRRSAA